MSLPIALLGAFVIVATLWDAFESVIFPRRITRRVRLARIFYQTTWTAWRAAVERIPAKRLQDSLFSVYGPLSFLVLLGLWAFMLILGFALLNWSLADILESQTSLATNLYYSGTTLFTLGFGDIRPLTPLGRLLSVVEAGTGFGFLAVVIGHLPGLNQSFSRREINISLLDARAGSPPTAAEMLLRHHDKYGMEAIRETLREMEKWSAELLETHLSYPVLAYFRSQHENQSWLAALASILDTSAFEMVGIEEACELQAQLTFAMARHAVVDLALIFGTAPQWPEHDRLPDDQLSNLRFSLAAGGLRPLTGKEADRKLLELRGMYEPFLFALSRHFRLDLPPWVLQSHSADNWQMSIQSPEAGATKVVRLRSIGQRHF